MEGGAARLRLVRYGGVPVFDDPHDNGGISLCGRRMMGPALVLAEQKLPALSDADVTLIAVSVRPWNELSAVMMIGVVAPSLVAACLRASLIAASFASAPELQKKARSAPLVATSFCASSPCCGM